MRRKIQIVNRTRRSDGARRSHRQPVRHGAATAPASTQPIGARTLRRPQPNATHDPITLAAATWLACGIMLLGLTPLPLHDADLGWSLSFWLVLAPMVLLVAKCAIHPPMCEAAVVKSQAREGRCGVRYLEAPGLAHPPSQAAITDDRTQRTTPMRLASIRRSSSRRICR